MTTAGRPWRTLDELEGGAPAGRSDEFADGAFADPVSEAGSLSRRRFMGLVSTIAALAAGCSGREPGKIVPRAHDEAGERGQAGVPGLPKTFATAVMRQGRAMGVLGVTREGRPIKLEGNPAHPASLGASDAMMQAELLTLYHPGRSSNIRRGETVSTFDELSDELRRGPSAFAGRSVPVAILTEPVTSPSLVERIAAVLQAVDGARWYRHEPLENGAQREGVRRAVGREADVVPRIGEADVVVSIGEDFLGASPMCVAASRGWASRRRADDAAGAMSRVYVAEPVPTTTGAVADHRLPASPRRMEVLILALADALGAEPGAATGGAGESAASTLSEEERAWMNAAAADLRRAGSRGLVLAGPALPGELHALALALNERLGAIGTTLDLLPPVDESVTRAGELAELTDALSAGEVGLLLMLGVNPVYTAAPSLKFAEAMASAGLTVHAGLFADETAQRSAWHVPLAHALESWGDARAFDGTACVVQPLIEPLFGGRTAHELLSMVELAWGRSDRLVPRTYELVRSFWAQHAGGTDVEGWWRGTLSHGVVEGSAFTRLRVGVDGNVVREAIQKRGVAARRTDETIQLVIRPDPTIGGGEQGESFNPWLQELPKPITKLVWSNALELSPSDAKRLGVKNEDVAWIDAGGRRVEAAVWVSPGHAEGCCSLTLGYGRGVDHHFLKDEALNGANAYALRSADEPWVVEGVSITTTGRTRRLVTTQHHGRMEAGEYGHDPVRTVTAAQMTGEAAGGSAEVLKQKPRRVGLTLYPERSYTGRQWGMVIDLALCTGCSACVTACQAENNIPSVGPTEVRRGREMHWIRADRYYAGGEARPRLLHQPVPCMHCEKAPCEVVCPVGATQHSADGLNEMVYNRCIGTRYCSNNCPYKVRRFNFFDYAEGTRESLRPMRNPEVTVRGRGVMEKCTYCVQRIRNAEIRSRVEGFTLGGDDVVPACQQACPTGSIVFGNIHDERSTVSVRRTSRRHYALLEELNTQPRTTYLADVRNPSPELAEGGA